jgi:hypothetical protein
VFSVLSVTVAVMNLNKHRDIYVDASRSRFYRDDFFQTGFQTFSKQGNVNYEGVFIVMEIMDAWVYIFSYQHNLG